MKQFPVLLLFLFSAYCGFLSPVANAQSGSVDTSFSPVFTRIRGFVGIQSIAVQRDGKILAAGFFDAVNGVPKDNFVRLNPDGSVDPSFAPNPMGIVPFVALQEDGKIFVLDQWGTLFRLNSDGSFDTGFSVGLYIDPVIASLAIRADGKLVICGRTGSSNVSPPGFVAILNGDGSLVKKISASDLVYTVALQHDGKILVGGDFTNIAGAARSKIARLNSDGSLDEGFTASVSGIVGTIVTQPDGKFLISGGFSKVNGVDRVNVARLYADGTLDQSFRAQVSGGGDQIVVQADGKIVFGGPFTDRIARFNSNGGLDSGFDNRAFSPFESMVMQADGKILLGLAFQDSNKGLVRLNNDTPKETLRALSTTHVQWLRGGGAPEVSMVRFELSTDDGGTWSMLTSGSGIVGGWECTGLNLPKAGLIRARAYVAGGQRNPAGLVESVQPFTFSSPIAASSGASGIGVDSATLRGKVNPNGFSTETWFEYGTSISYGASTSPQNLPSDDIGEIEASQVMSGFLPHTTYHFRIVARNREGTTYGADGTFTTGNALPQPRNDLVHAAPLAVNGGKLEVSVLANDSDPDSDQLEVANVTQGAKGAVTVSGPGTVAYIPGTGYDGNDEFNYTVSDGFGGTAVATVTISNAKPVAVADSFQPEAGTGPQNCIVLGNDEDPDGDTLTITGATDGKRGTVVHDGTTLTYTPGPGYVGNDSFTYTVTDGRGASATATVQVLPASTVVTHRILGGSQVPGEPVGTTFASFGIPSINSSGEIAFLGTMKSSARKVTSAIFSGSTPSAIVHTGDAAPGVPGTTYSSFKDPVLNAAGDVAFIATVAGAPKTGDTGIWLKRSGSNVELIAREGGNVEGVTGGVFASFLTLALPDTGRLVFTATLRKGSGGVNAKNDLGVWAMSEAGGLHLVLREGDTVGVNGADRVVKLISAFGAVTGSTGQRRGFNSAGDLLLRVGFVDGSEALIAAKDDGTLEEIAFEGGSLPVLSGAQLDAFGLGTLDRAGAAALRATLKRVKGITSAANNTVILSGVDLSEMQVIARSGSEVSIIPDVVFSTFQEPVANLSGDIAFVASIKGSSGAINKQNDTAIWVARSGSPLSMLVREGDNAPGTEGAKFASFASIALPDNLGVAFVGTLAAKVGGVAKTNDTGLWAQDRDGALSLLVREGQSIESDGVSKQLKTFTALGAVPTSPSQGHSYSGNGGFVYRAVFTDGSQGIISVWVP